RAVDPGADRVFAAKELIRHGFVDYRHTLCVFAVKFIEGASAYQSYTHSFEIVPAHRDDGRIRSKLRRRIVAALDRELVIPGILDSERKTNRRTRGLNARKGA